MNEDAVVAEVRRIRDEHAARFNYDVEAIAADLRKREEEHPELVVSFPPRPLAERIGSRR
jgi:hypothetical protein